MRAFVAKKRTEKNGNADHDQNAWQPIASTAKKEKAQNEKPDPAAEGSAEKGRAMTKTLVSMHKISFGYAYYTSCSC